MSKTKKTAEAPTPEELAKLLAKKDRERNASKSDEDKPGGRFKKGQDLGGGLMTVDHSDPIFSNKVK